MKTLLCSTIFAILAASGFAQTASTSIAQNVAPYEVILKSKPVLINGLEFRAATQTQWLAWNPPTGSDSVEVQLFITNRSKKDMIFKIFDTFRVVIKDANGNEIPCVGGRDETFRTKPVLIRAEDTYCLSRKATLGWSDSDYRTFDYEDGTGSSYTCTKLVAGKYSLSFQINSKGNDEGMAVFIKHHGFSGETPLTWEGEGTTREVPFEIVDPPADK